MLRHEPTHAMHQAAASAKATARMREAAKVRGQAAIAKEQVDRRQHAAQERGETER
jgi:hypothetical protein